MDFAGILIIIIVAIAATFVIDSAYEQGSGSNYFGDPSESDREEALFLLLNGADRNDKS